MRDDKQQGSEVISGETTVEGDPSKEKKKEQEETGEERLDKKREKAKSHLEELGEEIGDLKEDLDNFPEEAKAMKETQKERIKNLEEKKQEKKEELDNLELQLLLNKLNKIKDEGASIIKKGPKQHKVETPGIIKEQIADKISKIPRKFDNLSDDLKKDKDFLNKLKTKVSEAGQESLKKKGPKKAETSRSEELGDLYKEIQERLKKIE